MKYSWKLVFTLSVLLASSALWQGRAELDSSFERAAIADGRDHRHRLALAQRNRPAQSNGLSPEARARVNGNYGKIPLSFEANTDQTGREVRYLARGQGYGLYLTPTEAVMVLSGKKPGDRKTSADMAEGERPPPPSF